MANILTHPAPRLADVQCSRLKFEPGDRLLVRVHVNLSPKQKRSLRKSVEKWAGDCVEVLIYNELEMSIDVERPVKIQT